MITETEGAFVVSISHTQALVERAHTKPILITLGETLQRSDGDPDFEPPIVEQAALDDAESLDQALRQILPRRTYVELGKRMLGITADIT